MMTLDVKVESNPKNRHDQVRQYKTECSNVPVFRLNIIQKVRLTELKLVCMCVKTVCAALLCGLRISVCSKQYADKREHSFSFRQLCCVQINKTYYFIYGNTPSTMQG